MNPNRVLELLKEKQYLRVIKACEFELNHKQIKLGEWL